ncbi:MAG: SufE family protein [Rhodobiaceae bacterium]|nr:SufE family protein [Rhodobiaceae bacterium]MCC0054683.1 SufE family protein [Rhodobiaceae bacterium]
MTIEQILDDFSYLDDWEDRYRYVIELGKALPEFSETDRSPANKVEGCVSQVWLKTRAESRDGKTVLTFTGDSDAHIVRGLIAILFAIYSGHSPEEITATDAAAIMSQLGLKDHLTQQRSNGLHAMIARIRAEASAAAAA